jgi:hypothetical protein
MIFIIIDVEVEWNNRFNYAVFYNLMYIRFINSIISLLLIAIILYQKKIENNIFKTTYSLNQNILTISGTIITIIKSIIVSIIIYPGLDTTISNNFYYIKRMLAIMSFMKIYLIIEQLVLSSPFENSKVKFLRSMMNIELKTISLYKSWFANNKKMFLILFPFIFFPLASYILFISERVEKQDYTIDDNTSCINDKDFFDFIWLTGVSFFTSILF